MSNLSPLKIITLIGALISVFVLIGFSTSILETNNAGNVQVKQAAISGDMTCQLDPGMYGQYFGTIHTYSEAATYDFDGQEGSESGALPIRFADATKASVSGTVRVLLPVNDCEAMVRIHRKFKSFGGVMNKLVEPAMRKAFFNTGPFMTAAESYAERRGEMSTLAEDQLINGVIRVDTKDEEVTDPLTGEKTVVARVVPRKCPKENGSTCIGGYQRDIGVFREFSVTLTNFVIGGITYPKNVLAQIEAQRSARMDIITLQASAQQSEARAKKAGAEAEAAIAETRAKEEIEKTQRIVMAEANKAEAILRAQQMKEVASLEKDAAEFQKKKSILIGEGEAARKRLVMQADGALQQKLDAYVKVQAAYASALANAKPGSLVPSFQMGGSNGGSNAQDLIQLLTAKSAKDLALDLGVQK